MPSSDPACWSWPLPPLPTANSIGVVVEWQDGRCAICGSRPAALQEDHDHATGDTRGYLCASCNVREATSGAAAFAGYRVRPPTAMLGVLHRYHCKEHPVVRNARIAWESALSLHEQDRKARDQYDVLVANAAAMPELVPLDWTPPPPRLNAETPLLAYLRRAGLTWDEWYGVNGRARLRAGDVFSPEWRDFMRAELIRWARERRSGVETRDPGGHLYSTCPETASTAGGMVEQ